MCRCKCDQDVPPQRETWRYSRRNLGHVTQQCLALPQDLVKTIIKNAMREEVEGLKERIKELEQVNQLLRVK